MSWYNSNWKYRKKITLTGQTGAGTKYQVKLLIGESSGATGEDFDLESNSSSFPSTENISGDLRFTSSDGTTLLDFWVESVSGTTPNRLAIIWVEVAADLGSNQDIYCYYNGTTTNVSNGDNTFILFDDFNGTIIDTDKWTKTGTPTISSGQLHTNYYSNAGAVFGEGIISNSISTEKISIEYKMAGTNNHKGVCYSLNGNDVYGGSASPSMEIYSQLSGGDIAADGYDTARHSNVIGISDNNWHTYKITWDGTNARYSYDGGTETVQEFSFTPSNWKVGIGNNGFNTSVTQDIEYIFVHKFITTEPSFNTSGSQESNTSTSNFLQFF